MDTQSSFPTDQQYLKPNYMTVPGVTHSGTFLGSTGNFSNVYMPGGPIYNSGAYAGPVPTAFGHQQPPNFMFRERKGRVNWRNIANLDVDEVAARGDIKTLEQYLSNITFSNIDKDDIEKFGDATLLKLFRLSQYGLEYLLNCQNYLANQSLALDQYYRQTEDKLRPLEEQARANQAQILNLKSDVKQKKKLIKTYQHTLDTPLFRCHMCPKYFKSQNYLDSHFQRKHGLQMGDNVNPKIVIRDNSTSPTLPYGRTLDGGTRVSDRYGKSRMDDGEPYSDVEGNQRGRNGGLAPHMESTVENSFQLQNSALEKLLKQMKEDDDIKLSQLNQTLQDRLQEVLKSNQELTSKIAVIEKRLESQNGSPVKDQKTPPASAYATNAPGTTFWNTPRQDGTLPSRDVAAGNIQYMQTPQRVYGQQGGNTPSPRGSRGLGVPPSFDVNGEEIPFDNRPGSAMGSVVEYQSYEDSQKMQTRPGSVMANVNYSTDNTLKQAGRPDSAVGFTGGEYDNGRVARHQNRSSSVNEGPNQGQLLQQAPDLKHRSNSILAGTNGTTRVFGAPEQGLAGGPTVMMVNKPKDPNAGAPSKYTTQTTEGSVTTTANNDDDYIAAERQDRAGASKANQSKSQPQQNFKAGSLTLDNDKDYGDVHHGSSDQRFKAGSLVTMDEDQDNAERVRQMEGTASENRTQLQGLYGHARNLIQDSQNPGAMQQKKPKNVNPGPRERDAFGQLVQYDREEDHDNPKAVNGGKSQGGSKSGQNQYGEVPNPRSSGGDQALGLDGQTQSGEKQSPIKGAKGRKNPVRVPQKEGLYEDDFEPEDEEQGSSTSKGQVNATRGSKTKNQAGGAQGEDIEQETRTKSKDGRRLRDDLPKGTIGNGNTGIRQVFYAGELKGDIESTDDVIVRRSGSLEDDQDSFTLKKNSKKAQEEFVIMEQDGEDDPEHHGTRRNANRGDRLSQKGNTIPTIENDEDVERILEEHMTAVKKAYSVMDNKYKNPVTREQQTKLRADVDKDINDACLEIFDVQYKQLPDQSIRDLEFFQSTLAKANKRREENLIKLEKEYQAAQKRNLDQLQYSTSTEKFSQEGLKTEYQDGQTPQARDKKLLQSGELMNLIVNQGGQPRDSMNSQDTSTQRKQVFDSQNLELHLNSNEDFKKSGQLPKAKPSAFESSNMIKKSLDVGNGEQLW